MKGAQPADTLIAMGELILIPAARCRGEVRLAAKALWLRTGNSRASGDMIKRIEARFIAERRLIGIEERVILRDMDAFSQAVDAELARIEDLAAREKEA